MKYHPLILTLISLLIVGKNIAQKNDTGNTILKTIQENGQRFLKNKNINAVSIGVYKDGTTYSKHFGELEKGKGNTPNDNTIYEIGSISKTITGYLVAKAVLDGKLKLEDDVREYLNGDYPNLAYQTKPITIQHLLTHTSGLPMFLPLSMNGLYETLAKDVPGKYLELEKSYSKKQFWEDLSMIEINIEPGSQYAYSNAGAELIGHVLETIYKKGIDDLLREHFGEQQNMTSTLIQLDPAQEQQLVQGYWMDNQNQAPNQLNTLWATGGGMKMNMADMLRYMELQLDKNNSVVTASHEMLYEAGTLKGAYFWRVWQDKYGTSYNHHGGTSGMQNWLFIFPKYNLGISIITNQSGPKTPQLLSKTAKKMLKDIID